MENLLSVMEHHRVFLVFTIYFLQSCQVSRSIGLTIDSQLAIVANDCFTRVAIGSKLPDTDIFANVATAVISECEDECSRRRNSCNAFAFGIGVKGNGTCALSTKMPKSEELQTHADYDVYLRSQQSPQCEPDRLYKMGNGDIGQQRRNNTRPSMRFGSGLFGPAMPNILSSPRNLDGIMLNVNDPSGQERYIPSFDDERRVSDIVRNKYPASPADNPFGTNNAKVDNDPSIYSSRNNWKSIFGQRTHSDPNHSRSDFDRPAYRNPFADINYGSYGDRDLHSYKALTVHNGPFDVFSKPIFIQDETTKHKSPTDFEIWPVRDPTKHRGTVTNHFDLDRNQGFFNNARKSQGIITRPKQNEFFTGIYDIGKISRPIFTNSYSFETSGVKISNGGFKDISEIWNPRLLTTFRGFGAKISEKARKFCRPNNDELKETR